MHRQSLWLSWAYFFTVPAIQSWMPSIKLLHPLRLIVEPACLTRWSTHPLRLSQRVVHRFITQDQSLQPSAHPHRGWGFHPRTCYLQVDWFKAVSFLLTQDHLTWIVPLYSCLSQNTASHMATSRAAHVSFFPRSIYSHNKKEHCKTVTIKRWMYYITHALAKNLVLINFYGSMPIK